MEKLSTVSGRAALLGEGETCAGQHRRVEHVASASVPQTSSLAVLLPLSPATYWRRQRPS
jgi:hypothetical protein